MAFQWGGPGGRLPFWSTGLGRLLRISDICQARSCPRFSTPILKPEPSTLSSNQGIWPKSHSMISG